MNVAPVNADTDKMRESMPVVLVLLRRSYYDNARGELGELAVCVVVHDVGHGGYDVVDTELPLKSLLRVQSRDKINVYQVDAKKSVTVKLYVYCRGWFKKSVDMISGDVDKREVYHGCIRVV